MGRLICVAVASCAAIGFSGAGVATCGFGCEGAGSDGCAAWGATLVVVIVGLRGVCGAGVATVGLVVLTTLVFTRRAIGFAVICLALIGAAAIIGCATTVLANFGACAAGSLWLDVSVS